MILKQAIRRFEKMKTLRNQRYTLKEIGEKFNVGRERVRQILAKGIPTEQRYRVLSPLEKYLQSVNQVTGRDRVREMVRFRDKHTCKDCGKKVLTKDILKFNKTLKTQKGKKKALDVHHINGKCGKLSLKYESKDKMKGMITLCHKCHYNRPEHTTKGLKFSRKMRKIKNG